MRYCTKCGAPLAGTPRFCTKCGAPVRQAVDPGLPDAGSPAAAAAPPDVQPWPQAPPPAEPAAAEPPPLASGPPAPEDATPAFRSWQSAEPASHSGLGEPATAEVPSAGPPPLPDRQVPSSPKPPSSSARTFLVAAAVVILAAGGGLAAWKLLVYHPAHKAGSPGDSTGTLNHHPSSVAPSPSLRASTESPGPSPSPISPGNPDAVTIAPAVNGQPAAAQVASFLQTYFTAINAGDYARYASLWPPRLRPTIGQFRSGYRGSHDSHAILAALSPTAVGVAATVTFTSHQPAANSPTHTGCTDWNVTLYLRSRGSGYRIVSPPTGYHPQYRRCL